MKSVLISINPKWCELIASSKKTVEVRKTRPKLETPFKVYIYCTENGGVLQKVNNLVQKVNDTTIDLNEDSTIYDLNGKVIGEFVCDWVESTPLWRIKGNTGFCAKRTDREENLPKMACLSIKELEKYACSENRLIYGWHIDNLVIYDEPKGLHHFFKPCGDCDKKGTSRCTEELTDCRAKVITRPPQSWCYVEELK